MVDFRGKLSKEAYNHLKQIQELLGHSRPITTVEHLINRAYPDYLAPTGWTQTQQKALQVLSRLKPGLLIEARDITGVSFTNNGQTIEISVVLESQPYKIPRREWEQ
jgi:hypothetical protein